MHTDLSTIGLMSFATDGELRHFVAIAYLLLFLFIRHLRQYHEEREGKGIKTTEYFLGDLIFFSFFFFHLFRSTK